MSFVIVQKVINVTFAHKFSKDGRIEMILWSFFNLKWMEKYKPSLVNLSQEMHVLLYGHFK